MVGLTCQNKRCQHQFYSSENKKIVKCPVCNTSVYNMEKIINTENFLYIENVIRNLQTYGEKGLMDAIDRVYHNPLQRARIRQIHINEINKLKSEV